MDILEKSDIKASTQDAIEKQHDLVCQIKALSEENAQYQLTVKKLSLDLQTKDKELTKQTRLSEFIDSILNDRIQELEQQLFEVNAAYRDLISTMQTILNS